MAHGWDEAPEAGRKTTPPVDRPYEVGKGRPPAAHRFKKGGKPGPGRPKGAKTKSNYDRLADQRVTVGHDARGRPIRKTFRDVIDLQLLKKAAGGDLQAIKIAKEFELKMRALERSAETSGKTAGVPDDLAEREVLAGRLAGILDTITAPLKGGITVREDGRSVLAPFVIEALGDFREKHGAPRDPGPDGQWSPFRPGAVTSENWRQWVVADQEKAAG